MYLDISQLCVHGGSDSVRSVLSDTRTWLLDKIEDMWIVGAWELASEKTSCNIVLKTRQARGRLALQAVGDSLH